MTSTPPPADAHSTFPQQPEEFDSDPRVSWSRLTSKWTLEAEDGMEYEYEERLRRWVPLLDESLAEQQRKAYAIAGVDESEPAIAPQKKKRKKVYTGEDEEEASSKKKNKSGNGDAAPQRKNTAVYATNLPHDITEDEVNQVFSKCGVIAEEIDGKKPRIKIYRDEEGKPKGDALVVFFRPESVDLAVQMLDDTDFRLGISAADGRMMVQAADFSYKAQQDAPVKKNAKDKRKIIKKTQRLNNKLADWDDDDPSAIHSASAKYEKLVVLKHMFTLQELEEDATAVLDLKEDVREECEKLGDVTNVLLYDKEPEGIITVRFRTVESAHACVRVMDGRFFGGQKVEAYIADGSEKFKKSAAKDEEEDEAERLENFGSWLEKDVTS